MCGWSGRCRAVGGGGWAPVRGWPHGVAAAPRWAHAWAMVQRVVTVNGVLEGHVALHIECLDRIYLNAYVPILQTSSQVVAFLSGHLGFPFPSPVLFRQLDERFRRAVASFADSSGIPWIRFGEGEAKLEVTQPHLALLCAWPASGAALARSAAPPVQPAHGHACLPRRQVSGAAGSLHRRQRVTHQKGAASPTERQVSKQ
jgi:hypothetical protein